MTYVRDVVRGHGGAVNVARRIGVTESSVYNWVKHNRLPGYAADILGVKPCGKFSKAGRPSGDRKYKPTVKRGMFARFIAWLRNV